MCASLLHQPEAEKHEGATEKYTPPAVPHLTTALGGVVRSTRRESRMEVPNSPA